MGTELPEVIGYTIIVTSQVLVGGRSFDPSVRLPGVTCQPPGVFGQMRERETRSFSAWLVRLRRTS